MEIIKNFLVYVIAFALAMFALSSLNFEKLIKKTDRHNHLAYLSFDFFDHPIKIGLTIMPIKELRFRNLCDEDIKMEATPGKRNRRDTEDTGKAVIYDEESDEDVEIDLKELISRMTQL